MKSIKEKAIEYNKKKNFIIKGDVPNEDFEEGAYYVLNAINDVLSHKQSFVSNDTSISEVMIVEITKILEQLKKTNNDKQKLTTVDVDFLVESYKQRLFEQCKTTGNYPIIDVCAAAFREGVENTLDELDLRTFINKSKENQDVQKPTDIHPIFKVGDIIRHKKEGFTCKIIAVDTEYRLSECNGTHLPFDSQDAYELVEQNPTDKVQPKFKVGDWVTDNKDALLQVTKFEDDYGYELKAIDGQIFHFVSPDLVDANYHLWSIKDAKPGDVLFHSDSASNGIFIFKEIIDKGFANEVICYCDYDSEDHFCLGEHHTCCWADAKILYPATKEQRDLLFAKMKENGYEWDANSKELHKIKE